MIAIILCFALVFATIALVEGKVKVEIKEQCDFTAINAGINDVIKELNSNSDYTDFIANSGYNAVKLVVGKVNVYYFIYDAETKQVGEVSSAQEDFTIKATCKQMNKIVDAYNSDNPKINSIKFNRMILNRIPMKVKSKLIDQCFKTPWCLNRILGK